MDIRRPIRDTAEPKVLSVAFNNDCTRFACGLDDGLRIFRAKDCIRTVKEAIRPGHGLAIVETLDDRYAALVGGGRLPNSSPNKLEFWDLVENKKLKELNFGEPIIAIRVTAKYCIVVLLERSVSLEYVKDTNTDAINLGTVKALYRTAKNPYGLCCIRGDTLALPGETPGQFQVLTLSSKDKKVFKAHESSLRQMAMSWDGTTIATASERGTIIRIFSTTDATMPTELRRGVESASIWGLAFSPSADWLASTSDKGTIHVWDLRGSGAAETRVKPAPSQRKRGSVSRINHDYDTISHVSGSSSPLPGVVATPAGFMPLPSDLYHAPPSSGPSIGSYFSGLAKGIRSTTSTEFTIGSDPSNWQGQPRYTNTTLPNGQTANFKNENVAVPGRPDGKPPKGVLAWDPEGGDRRLWVVEGGADPRWEVFELVNDVHTGDVKIVSTGFRKYLTRQFPEKS
ncbi:WD40 repeat-like protein [Aureobasidium subglaciale]|nr:WD40 repeat-like protein [Aureobasidium subglaciale]